MNEVLTHYGDMLTEKIQESIADFSKISDFNKFVLDNGYKYATKEELQAGYDRHWKASRNILVTMEEFLKAVPKFIVLSVVLVILSAALPAYSQALFINIGIPVGLAPTLANIVNILMQVIISYPTMKFWVMPDKK